MDYINEEVLNSKNILKFYEIIAYEVIPPNTDPTKAHEYNFCEQIFKHYEKIILDLDDKYFSVITDDQISNYFNRFYNRLIKLYKRVDEKLFDIISSYVKSMGWHEPLEFSYENLKAIHISTRFLLNYCNNNFDDILNICTSFENKVDMHYFSYPELSCFVDEYVRRFDIQEDTVHLLGLEVELDIDDKIEILINQYEYKYDVIEELKRSNMYTEYVEDKLKSFSENLLRDERPCYSEEELYAIDKSVQFQFFKLIEKERGLEGELPDNYSIFLDSFFLENYSDPYENLISEFINRLYLMPSYTEKDRNKIYKAFNFFLNDFSFNEELEYELNFIGFLVLTNIWQETVLGYIKKNLYERFNQKQIDLFFNLITNSNNQVESRLYDFLRFKVGIPPIKDEVVSFIEDRNGSKIKIADNPIPTKLVFEKTAAELGILVDAISEVGIFIDASTKSVAEIFSTIIKSKSRNIGGQHLENKTCGWTNDSSEAEYVVDILNKMISHIMKKKQSTK